MKKLSIITYVVIILVLIISLSFILKQNNVLNNNSENISTENSIDNIVENTLLSVDYITFNWDETNNTFDAINIRKNLTETIKTPEYTKSLHSPILYKVNQSNIKIKVKFCIEDNKKTKYTIQGFAGKNNRILSDTDSQVVKFNNGKSDEIIFTLSSSLPNNILHSYESIIWKITKCGTGEVETKDIEVYTVFNSPSVSNQNPWKLDCNSEQTPWSDALELLFSKNGANINNTSSEEEALKLITAYFFEKHGAYYDTHEYFLNQYCHAWENKFNLSKYLWQISEEEKVSCHTQAGIVYIMSKLLGINPDVIYFCKWGYINTTNLVGVGPCNNPFYQPVTCDNPKRPGVPVTDTNNIHRSLFGSHVLISYNDKIYDATLGPALGTQSLEEYLKTMIDISTPKEASKASYPNSFDKKEIWNDKYSILKIE